MTINELSNVAGCDRETVREITKKLLPEKIVNGKKTIFNQQEARLIMDKLPKRNMVSIPTENTVGRYLTVNDIPNIVAETVKALMPIIQSKPEQKLSFNPELKQYSVLGYAKIKGINAALINPSVIGKKAAQYSRIHNLQIGLIPDERYGSVGSYTIEALESVFSSIMIIKNLI